MAQRVFLDINMGDEKAFQVAFEAHERAKEFVKQKGEAYGLPSNSLEKLLATQDPSLEGIADFYDAEPEWKKKGPMQVQPPPSLLVGRVVVELFVDVAPKTSANFRALCTGEKGKGKAGKLLHFKGCRFHRIVKDFVCQGGDIVFGDGTGGDSIYGGKFNDEKEALKKKHNAAGIVSMANSGKNTDSSQFFFTFAPLPNLDGKHVVFGQVIEGLEILQKINSVAASDGAPKLPVWIADCGELK
eukprot:TRINITY_DN2139_c0_g1_i1.p1 TRINITY_DN2139_c0_g1~~TRINITY_DN2139_c0_g1_i1.p1  ORF type:complete len:265 (+),score=93.90 TRINITY_DN2139_c0_g1_i1:67-795(+)